MASPAPILCDIDGVVWLLREPIDGSPEAIAALRGEGHDVWFVTNNSYAPVSEQEAALESIGVPAAKRVLTAAEAAAQCLEPGERVILGGGPGVVHELERRGVEIVGRSNEDGADGRECDAVVVGIHFDFDYSGLRRLASAARRTGRLVGTNGDLTYPTPRGEIPGGGSIIAAVAAAAGVEPTIAGKPNEPMATLVRSRTGAADLSRAWMIGDRGSTDGAFARQLGCRFALVGTGVHGDQPAGIRVDLRGSSLADVAGRILSS